MHFRRVAVFFTVFLVSCLSCSSLRDSLQQGEIDAVAESITAQAIMEHVRVLSSDEFEGRAPATHGEELTVDYLVEQFSNSGLAPGNPDGTYVQDVPLVEFQADVEASFSVGGKKLPFSPPEDFVLSSRRTIPEVVVENSEIVFVGYGIVAPEYGWDDYKDVDVTGKTILMLVNDPRVSDPEDPELELFKGNAMTYYGRWTYKYEIATQKGAAAAFVIHETDPAGYPYEVISRDFGLSQFDIQHPDLNIGRVPAEGWMHRDATAQLMDAAGLDYEEMKKAALSRDFRPVALSATADFRIQNGLRNVNSRNVVALLEGSDPDLKEELVVYMAHWDHLGVDPNLEGDQIFNGAFDNATGTAGLLELARAFAQIPVRPLRSILFLSVTAEEQGLLGSYYYADNPLYPLSKTVATINMDGLNQWGLTSDVTVIGLGNSTLDDVLISEAESSGRTVKADPEPEKGFFYRSDHFPFAKKGVPSLYPDEGVDFIGKAEGFSSERRGTYIEKDYHKVSDEIKEDWDLSGAADDLKLFLRVGMVLANSKDRPQWKEGAEFQAAHESLLASKE